MKLKEGVNPTGLKPEILLAIIVSQSIYHRYGYELTLTSITDGAHNKNSLHYVGLAVDLRIRNITHEPMRREICDEISDSLGSNYDVILEPTHIHIEYQP